MESCSTDCYSVSCVTSTYPQEIAWTISFDGKSIGELIAKTRTEAVRHSNFGLQQITSHGAVPTIGTRSRDYSGFLEVPVLRPLIANSKPFSSDPEMWTPAAIPSREVTMLRRAFRKKFPKLCRETKLETGPLEPFAYKDEDISVLKAYSSKAGWMVARLHLEAIDCDDVEAGFEMDDPWFTVSPDKAVAYLDAGMWLVDAGDYDNDGKSEIVFSIDRYNRGGYEIFYDDFRKHAVFEFGYH
jgi:hypothetical protein